MTVLNHPVALITGAARRIGAEIVRKFHTNGFNIALHHNSSIDEAHALANELNSRRNNSVNIYQAELANTAGIKAMVNDVIHKQGRIDILINNASSFYPTPLSEANETQWEDLLGSNLKGPYFLCQAAAPYLQIQRGSIVTITDIYARSPLTGYSVYCIAKAGNAMMIKALAKELAPDIRVNGIAPGVILWPNSYEQMDEETRKNIIDDVPLKRIGSTADIANTAFFLATSAGYITGQVITVDGGSSLNI